MQLSDAHKLALSKAARLAFKEGRRKVMRYWTGKKQSISTQRKKRKAMLGRFDNENHPQWKGDKVKYMGLHNWVRRRKGTPKYCEDKKCKKISKKYQWANRSGRYSRDLKDWIRLCVSCHMRRDYKKGRFIKNKNRLKIT